MVGAPNHQRQHMNLNNSLEGCEGILEFQDDYMSKQPSASDLFAGAKIAEGNTTSQRNGAENELIKIQDNNFVRDVKAGGRDDGAPPERIHHGGRDDQRKKPPQVPSLGNKIMQVQKVRQRSNPSAGTANTTVGGNTGNAEMVAG